MSIGVPIKVLHEVGYYEKLVLVIVSMVLLLVNGHLIGNLLQNIFRLKAILLHAKQ